MRPAETWRSALPESAHVCTLRGDASQTQNHRSWEDRSVSTTQTEATAQAAAGGGAGRLEALGHCGEGRWPQLERVHAACSEPLQHLRRASRASCGSYGRSGPGAQTDRDHCWRARGNGPRARGATVRKRCPKEGCEERHKSEGQHGRAERVVLGHGEAATATAAAATESSPALSLAVRGRARVGAVRAILESPDRPRSEFARARGASA
jgi:hypothetical protein